MSKKEGKDTSIAVRRPFAARPWRPAEFDTLFDRFFSGAWPRQFQRPWFNPPLPHEFGIDAPPLDLYEEKNELVIKAEIPGIAKEDLDISVTENMLTIKGEKRKEETIKEVDYFRSERDFGMFSRSIELPVHVKVDGVKATFRNGVLEIRLPKTEAAKHNVVHVRVA
ncbi:MAG TPA: Hsp20/alpha crystallin family protein [Terriglobia bacterium]|nr:Hsp20/alpha crystallin family protein [Terriglobia bacterium]